MTPATRMSSEERRGEVIDAAAEVFAAAGYDATSTEEVARRAGISQPYIFRLFGSKRELFVAAVERCFQRTADTFDRASAGLSGPEALYAMGHAYAELISDPTVLRLQLHAYAAATDDTEVRGVAQRALGQIWALVEARSGADVDHIRTFFATGMLCNVIAAVGLDALHEPWAQALVPPKPDDTAPPSNKSSGRKSK